MSPGCASDRSPDSSLSRGRDCVVLILLSLLLWGVHWLWLSRDTRPPVWDMAMHQSYALNYLPETALSPASRFWDLSGNYPPFVHIIIAFACLCFHPGPHIAVLANIPATLLLLWGVYELGRRLAGAAAARWACVLLILTPYVLWMSRETILDYWLSAWIASSLALLLLTRNFESRPASVFLGFSIGFGLLTKWIFAGLFVAPFACVCLRSRIWQFRRRLVNAADSALLALGLSGLWYIPNFPKLTRYFHDNTRIGAREGEPPILSFQSLIYYLRLLEGYQLFGLLFLLLTLSVFFVLRKRLISDRIFWLTTLMGGWLAMTLLRTKDPRFTMPLIGPLLIACGAWLHSWGSGWNARLIRGGLICLFCLQAYAINFGISWLPQEVVLVKGYQGSLRWDWNLYMQHYFHILGPPRAEDWKQEAILRRIAEHSAPINPHPALAVVPDMARFSAANFHLVSRLLHIKLTVDHPQVVKDGIRSFDGFDYAVMTEREQGMPWSTLSSRALNQIIMDEHEVFRLLDLYLLPNGDAARLYHIQRGAREGG